MPKTRSADVSGDAGLAGYRRWTPARMIRQLRKNIGAAEAMIAKVTQPGVPDTWDRFIRPMQEVHDHLEMMWGRIEHLHRVVNSPVLRKIVAQGEALVSKYSSRYMQDIGLYAKFQRLRSFTAYKKLSPDRQRVITLALQDFRLAGAHLPSAKRQKIRRLRAGLAKASTTFSTRLLDATQAGVVVTTNPKDLADIPENVVAEARQRALLQKKTGWLFSIQSPGYTTVMRTASSRSLRQKLYRLSVRRASEFGPTKLNNTPIIAQILRDRQLLAQELGFRTYVEFALSRRMASTANQVQRFLQGIARAAKLRAIRDRHDLDNFARNILAIDRLQPWDLDFAYEKMRTKRFGFSQEELRPYFPHVAVMKAMFEATGKLFNLRWRPARNFRAYDPTVQAYDCFDRHGPYRGRIVFDLFARPTKHAGAWLHGDTARRRIHGRVRHPIVYCVGNFPVPDKQGISFLSHDDVHTFFHECGHGLHYLLSDIDEPEVSGTNGVEWDAVELPSQWLQRLAWEPTVLDTVGRFSRRPMPKQLRQQLLASEKFGRSLWVLRQIQLGLFDVWLHQQTHVNEKTALKVWRQVVKKYSVMPTTLDNRFPNSFSHIFEGHYAAGYYSYMWAEVLAADAYEPLHTKKKTWSKVGHEFRREILSVGGSRPAAASFRALRKRDPVIQPLLRSYGLKAG